MRAPGGVGRLMAAITGLTLGCADPAGMVDAGDGVRPGGDGPGPGGDAGPSQPDAAPIAGAPQLGAHALVYNVFGVASPDPLRTPARQVVAGSWVLVMVAKGTAADIVAPSDSQGQVYPQHGATQTYVNWPSSGNALFIQPDLAASPSHQVQESMAADVFDECTLSMLEVRGAAALIDVAVSETPSRGPVTSGTVTTTGPALLVAYWWGDSVVAQHTATPSDGFTVVHALLPAQPIVQVAVAVKQVAAAGTYDVTWTATPDQGAITWLLALQ